MSRHHGRAAVRISVPVVIGLLVLVGLLWSGHQWRQRELPLQPLLPTVFEHSDHGETQCSDCHHNWLDDTGSGTCYNCHKTDPEVSAQMEAMFHQFCWGCHIEERHRGEEESGPLRACSLCHPG